MLRKGAGEGQRRAGFQQAEGVRCCKPAAAFSCRACAEPAERWPARWPLPTCQRAGRGQRVLQAAGVRGAQPLAGLGAVGCAQEGFPGEEHAVRVAGRQGCHLAAAAARLLQQGGRYLGGPAAHKRGRAGVQGCRGGRGYVCMALKRGARGARAGGRGPPQPSAPGFRGSPVLPRLPVAAAAAPVRRRTAEGPVLQPPGSKQGGPIPLLGLAPGAVVSEAAERQDRGGEAARESGWGDCVGGEDGGERAEPAVANMHCALCRALGTSALRTLPPAHAW